MRILFYFLIIIKLTFCIDLIDAAHFPSKSEAQTLLSSSDTFISNLSQFDIDSRVQKPNSTIGQLISFISSQVQNWNDHDIQKIKSILKSIDISLSELGLILPNIELIPFVKTTGLEEGGADGYTRANYIVLSSGICQSSDVELKEIITHELFHLYTRSDKIFRERMYNLIGFRLMNEVQYPEGMKENRITNPDAQQTDSYIVLNMDGNNVECMMVLFSGKEYEGGSFFDYLNVGFMKLTGEGTKHHFIENEMPVIYNFQQISNFIEQVGLNTQYIIHPEEILADNFAFLINGKPNLKSQWLIENMKIELQNN